MGNRFEVKMTLLLYLRALNMKVNFKLSTNDNRYGGFDDVILRYTSGDKEVLVMIQLKHKHPAKEQEPISSQALEASTGGFSLSKYFHSYCDIVSGPYKSDLMHFIVYTNRQCDCIPEQPQDKRAEIDSQGLQDLLKTGGNRSSVSRFNTANAEKLCGAFESNPKSSDFREQFMLLSGQANVDELDELIRQEISKYFNIPGPERNEIFSKLFKEIENWYQISDSEVAYLSVEWSPLKTLKESLESKHKLITQVTFSQRAIEELASNTLWSNSNVVHICYTDGTGEHLYSLKMLQVIKEKDSHHKICISSLADENLDKILKLWENGHCDVLVIYAPDSADINSSTQHIGSEIVRILNQSTERKLVFISTENLRNLINFITESVINSCKDYIDKCTFTQFNESTQELIGNHPVTFQGAKISLKDIGKNRILLDIMRGKVLSELLNHGSDITIGKPLEFDSTNYVSRVLQATIHIREEIFADRNISDIFLIIGIKKYELQALVKNDELVGECNELMTNVQYQFYAVISAQWQKAVSQFSPKNKYVQILLKNKSIHLLAKEGGSFVWRASLGKKDTICSYINSAERESADIQRLIAKCQSTFVREEAILNSTLPNLKIFLVTGALGVGKSELQMHMASETMKLYPHIWILKVNLHFHKTETVSVTEELVVDLLKCTAGINNSSCPELSYALLQGAIYNTGNIVILLDAFDEVIPSPTSEIVAILDILLNKTVSSVWLSSRNTEQNYLESCLQTKSFKLNPLSNTEQEELLVKLWKNDSTTGIPGGTLNETIGRFLRQVKTMCPSEDGNPISGIPLFLKMLADICPGGTFHETNVELNLANIYEKFIDRKFKNFFMNLQIDTEIPGVSSVTNVFQNRLMKDYKLYSLCITGIFNLMTVDEKAKFVSKVNRCLNNMKRSKERVGIIDFPVNSPFPRFVHYSFAEYFAALWLIANKEHAMDVLKIVLQDFRYLFLKAIFNNILCQSHPLHLAVLSKDESKVRSALQKEDANARDGLGRTALHLAAQTRRAIDTAVMNQLLNNRADTEIEDKVFQWTPIYHAAAMGAWSAVIHLLHSGAKVQNNIAKEKCIQDLLIKTSRSGYCKCEATLFKAFDINWQIFDTNDEINRDTILHLAIKCQELHCVKMLLDKGANPHLANNKLITALSESVLSRNVDIVKLVLEKIIVLMNHPFALSPLYYACHLRLEEIVELLLQKGFDPNDCPKTCRLTALHAACTSTHEVKFSVSTDQPAEIHITTQMQEGSEPNLHIVKKLLKSKADVNARDFNGSTPLLAAVRSRSRKLVELLVKQGADANIAATDHVNPISYVIINGITPMVKMILDNSVKFDANCDHSPARFKLLHLAALGSHTEILKLLLEKGLNPNVTDNMGRTPLHYALVSDEPNFLEKFILLHSYAANITATDSTGRSPLQIACMRGKKSILEYMMEKSPRTVLSVLKKTPWTKLIQDNTVPQLMADVADYKKRVKKILRKKQRS